MVALFVTLALLQSATSGHAPVRDPAPDAPPRLGSGEHVYEWVRGWPEIPWGDALGATHGGVVVDAEGLVYVNTDTERAVCVFRPDGTFVRSFGAELGSGVHGMTIARESFGEGEREVLWLAWLHSEVVKTTLEGEILWRTGVPFESEKYKRGKPRVRYNPTGVAVTGGGFLVADGYGLSWIHRYDADGAWVATFGGPGSGLGQVQSPHGIALDPRGEEPVIVVADRDNARLQLFDVEGEPLGVRAEEHVRRPCSFAFQGRFAAVPDLAGCVTIFDEAWQPVVSLGQNRDPELCGVFAVPPERWRDGEFIAPHAAAWDADGNLYVVDWNRTGRVTKLRRVREAEGR